MAKKNSKKPKQDDAMKKAEQAALAKLPKEAQEKLKAIKTKIEKFQKQIVSKFGKYIMGVSLLPPPKPQEGKEVDKGKINVLVLIDDSDSKKMSKLELKDKLTLIIKNQKQ